MTKLYMVVFLLILTTTVFVILKLTSNIDWSWWVILAPIYVPSLIIGVLVGFWYLIGGVNVQ